MKTTTTLGSTALLAAALSCASPAFAGQGVKYAHLEDQAVDCSPSNPLPCPYQLGTPQTESNVLYVLQTEDAEGNLHFSALSTNTPGDDEVWFGTKYEAQCKSGYRLYSASLLTGYEYRTGNAIEEVTECTENCGYQQVEPVNPDHKTIPWRNRAFTVPLDKVLEELAVTPESLYAYGENMIAEKVDDGMSEADARAQTEDHAVGFPTALTIGCKGLLATTPTYNGDSQTMPLMIRYLGHGDVADLQPSDPVPPSDGQIDPQFVDQTTVTQAQLFAIPDPEGNGCGINLSAVFTTNDQTTIEYRLVNELGVKSQVFNVSVDQTHTAYVNHWLDLTDAVLDAEDLGLVAPTESDGPFGYTTEDTDRVQGYFQVEVLLPHHKMSNVASYNLPACNPTAKPVLVRR